MKFFRDESGQTLVFTALLACCLMGFMALAIDVGVLFRAQRKLQTAADAAAIAAGLASDYGMTVSGCGTGVSSVTCAAYKAAASNGVTDTTQITVNNPPLNGSHTGAEYYEVIIRQPNPTIFMSTFGSLMPGGNNPNYSTVTVGARAVSGIVAGQACTYALDKHADDAFDVQGAAVITTPNCSIQINSDSQQALCSTGGATINANAINIVGAQDPKGKCNKSQSNVTTGSTYVTDPLSGLTYPTCNGTNTFSVGGTNPTISSSTQLTNKAGTKVTFSPQTQTVGSGASATTASVVCFSDPNVTIASGVTLGTVTTDPNGNYIGGNEVFVFQNGVQIGGSVTIGGTLDNAGGSLAQNNFALTIYAPADTTATYNGLALIVPPTNTSNTCGGSYSSFKGTPAPGGCLQIQFGSGYGNLDGMIYAPAAAVYMQDNGGGTVVTGIIADEIYDKASSLIITDNYNLVHNTSPLNHVALVE